MSQQSINSNSDLSALLLFQDNFISTLHAHLYHKTHPFPEVFLTFQIHHVSDINDKFNHMLATLTSQLIDNKLTYELNLRDSFQRLLQADFLPLLRINRYQLTKLSLFGFDIYVEPLEAVLQILSRLDVSKKRLLQSDIDLGSVTSAESALQKGWQVYMAYLQEWKIGFNLYILQEYLRVGGKSFLKKDRQILFTGISNLYSQLVTTLSKRKNMKLLKQLAQLNNSLYHFHQSFNYFQFYTFLLPQETELQPIFALMKEIAQKCLRTNILTPLLFGILRHRESFLKFIQEANSPVWVPYLNAIVSGIAINLKFRILEYEQIMQLFEKAVNRAGLLGKIDTSYIFGTLQNGWKDAKQFFISAVKVGFNSGEVQIWKSVELEQIGPKVISSVIDGMLLNVEQNEQLGELLGQAGQKLEEQLLKVSDGKVNSQMFRSSICQLQKGIQSQQKLLNLLRILNLLQEGNEYCINFAITSILNANIEPKSINQHIINRCLNKINSLLTTFQTNNLTFAKENVIALHSKFKPQTSHDEIIQLYIRNYDPRKCLAALLKITPVSQPSCREMIIQRIAAAFLKQGSPKLVKIRTFQKQLVVKNQLINPSYETHSILSVLVHQLTTCEPTKTSQSVNSLTAELVTGYPWVAFCLLNFPVNEEGKICSFVSYLIQNVQHHQLLKQILLVSRGAVQSQEGVDLMQALTYPSICEHLCKKINKTEQTTQMLPYLNLLLWTIQHLQPNELLSRDLLAVYLFALETANSKDLLQSIVEDIARVSVLALGQKLQLWLAGVLVKRIQDKFELQRVSRKKVLKNHKNSVYFINEIQDDSQLTLQTCSTQQNKQVNATTQDRAAAFWEVFDRISKLDEQQLLSILEKQSNQLQQEFKHLLFPPINPDLLKELHTNSSPVPSNRTLQVVVLNTDNYLAAVQHSITSSDLVTLKAYRMVARLTSHINQLLKLQVQQQVNCMAQMSQGLSLRQRKRIAQSFYLEWSSLADYLEYIEGIEYLSIYNPANWRILMEYLNKQFSSFNLPSLLLQYRQYLSITSQASQQYECSIRRQGLLFKKYVRLFMTKLQSIFDQSVSQQQIGLKCAHELSSLNLAIVAVQLREITAKLGLLHKEMKERNITFDDHWIVDVVALNSALNKHIRGKVVLPNFTHGFTLTNDQVLNKYKVQIGTFLQSYYQTVGIDNNKEKYCPSQLNRVALTELSRDNMSIINPATLHQPVKQLHEQTIKLLKANSCVVDEADSWQINFENIVDSPQNLQLFYRLGCLSALIQTSPDHPPMPQLLLQLVSRQKLSWQLLKPIHTDQFHFIKSVLVEPQIATRQLFFVHEEEELIPEGRSIRVNDYNKNAYCEQIALKAIGQATLNCARHFFQGYTNQKSA